MNTVRATAINPATGTEHSVEFRSWASNQVNIGVECVGHFEREHGFTPDINKIVTWVG